MKYNSYHYLSIALTLGLSACSNIPSHLIVAPEIIASTAVYHHNKQAQLDVIDMRTANHIVQIIRTGEAATLLSARQNIEDTINNTLNKHWQKQGLLINNRGNNVINIAIEKAVISVNQKTMEYKAQTEIVLKVTINNGVQTLTSTFKNRGNSDGPLTADISVLERNFNLRLTKLLQQILTNEKIKNFLK